MGWSVIDVDQCGLSWNVLNIHRTRIKNVGQICWLAAIQIWKEMWYKVQLDVENGDGPVRLDERMFASRDWIWNVNLCPWSTYTLRYFICYYVCICRDILAASFFSHRSWACSAVDVPGLSLSQQKLNECTSNISIAGSRARALALSTVSGYLAEWLAATLNCAHIGAHPFLYTICYFVSRNDDYFSLCSVRCLACTHGHFIIHTH